jgi:hypothetical protein
VNFITETFLCILNVRNIVMALPLKLVFDDFQVLEAYTNGMMHEDMLEVT